MTIPDWVIFVIVIALVATYLFFIIMVTINIHENFKRKRIQHKTNRAILNTFQTFIQGQNYEQCLYEIDLILKKLVSKSSMLRRQFDSIITLLESFLVNINCENISCDNKENLKKSIIQFLNIYKSRNPLEQIKGSNFVILKELLDNNDKEKHEQIVNQLAIELKQKEDAIYNLQFKNKTAEITSKAGIVLTIVFGIVAIIQSL